MVSFEEYYNNKINEAAINTFDEMIKIKGNAWKTSKLAKTKAKEIIDQLLKDKELKTAFMHDAEQGTIKTDTDEYKNLALAMSVLAANKDQASKDYLNSLGVVPKEGESVKDLQVIKNINAGTKPLIRSIRATDKKAGDTTETPKNKTAEAETPQDSKATPKAMEGEKIKDIKAGDKTIPVTKLEKTDKQRLPPDSDERSPSFYSKKATENLEAAITDINDRADQAKDEKKKMKMKKVATDLQKKANSLISTIDKQQDKYSNHSNLRSRLKATNNSSKALREINTAIEAAKNQATLKGMKSGIEGLAQSAKNAGNLVKGKVSKVANSRVAQTMKDAAIKTAKVSKDAAKRGAEVAAPIIKSTTDKVVDKIKTTTSDAIIRKWYPEKFKDFVNSDDQKEQAAKAKIAPDVISRKNSEEKTLTDIPVQKYPEQYNSKIG